MNAKNVNHDSASAGAFNDRDDIGSLKNQFLIAMPCLENSIFSRSVTYICDHNENGAMGVIINQTLGITLGDVFDQLAIDATADIKKSMVLAGGPVNAQQGLVLHRDQGSWESTVHVTSEICVTASKDIVKAMAENRGPKSAQLALGYAGWGSGQLEEEIGNNCWLTMPADSGIIFDVPSEKRWSAAASAMGVDLNLISSVAGHA